ncbi:MAG: delta-aminolevulinic acid dehydratase [Bacteroidetes bacterium]|nr:delta-aminolevulinic acid dehydratase [Bacteroidota bacterium]
MNKELISGSFLKLQQYIESEHYKGYDPYDALKSPVFRLPIIRDSNKIRFLAQQFVKRFPLNMRPLLMIRKGMNPVTLGLCIHAYTDCLTVFPEEKNKYEEKINHLLDELEKVIPPGYHGACWGYDFDWASRYATVPAYQPTVVATGFITNALFHYFRVSGNRRALDWCISSAGFVRKDLNKTFDQQKINFCFSYSPFDHEIVFNANMKGARILAQVYSQTGDEQLKEEARKAVAFVMNFQQQDGSWVYSQSRAGTWVDNYHTGYILDCLDEYIRCTGDQSFRENLDKGYLFYRENFFTGEGIPKFYDKEIFPVDCTAAGQSLLTLVRFRDDERAGKVAEWMITNMQSEKGFFYFRKFRRHTNKTSFMRWSNAWMFAGMASLLASASKEGK